MINDLIQSFVAEKGSALIGQFVERLGLSADDAGGLLSSITDHVMGAFNGGKIDIAGLTDLDDVQSKISDVVNEKAIAADANVEPETAQSALDLFADEFTNVLQNKMGDSGGLLGLLTGGSDAGSALGGFAKKLGGGLLGR